MRATYLTQFKPPPVHHANKILCRTEIIKLLIMKVSLASCYFLPS